MSAIVLAYINDATDNVSTKQYTMYNMEMMMRLIIHMGICNILVLINVIIPLLIFLA